MRLSGLKITASTVERYIVNDGGYCPIPAGFSESDCTFLISGVAGWIGSTGMKDKPISPNCNYVYSVVDQQVHVRVHDDTGYIGKVWRLVGMNKRIVVARSYTNYDGYFYLLPLNRYGRYSVYVTVLALKKITIF